MPPGMYTSANSSADSKIENGVERQISSEDSKAPEKSLFSKSSINCFMPPDTQTHFFSRDVSEDLLESMYFFSILPSHEFKSSSGFGKRSLCCARIFMHLPCSLEIIGIKVISGCGINEDSRSTYSMPQDSSDGMTDGSQIPPKSESPLGRLPIAFRKSDVIFSIWPVLSMGKRSGKIGE